MSSGPRLTVVAAVVAAAGLACTAPAPTATPSASAPVSTPASTAPAVPTVVARAVPLRVTTLVHQPWGSGPSAFGRATSGDLGTTAPSAVLATENGDLLVLDPVNARLVRFDAAGRHLGDVPLPVTAASAAETTAAVYDPASRTTYVLDTARARLIVVTGARVTTLRVTVPDHDGIRLAGSPLVAAPDGVVYALAGDAYVPLAVGGRAATAAERSSLTTSVPPGSGGSATVAAGTLTVTTGGRATRVRLPGVRVLDAHLVPGRGQDLLVFAGGLAGGRPHNYVVRFAAGVATVTEVAYEAPGDVVEPVAAAAGGFVVLTAGPAGAALVRYA